MRYGRYQINNELGKGSMGVVYRAYDPQIDRVVALKVLRPDRISSETFVQRFFKEARAIGRLSHPYIVTVYDVGHDHDTIYIAMELLEGKPLNEIFADNVFGINDIVQIGAQIAETLNYAHNKGIIHRDIKPTNIVLTNEGHVKITDFGIARIEDPMATQQTQAGEILGTPSYMSPEQVRGEIVDGRSDLYSLGVLIYEFVTGKRPFTGETMASVFQSITQDRPIDPARVNPKIPKVLSNVIKKCLSKNPNDRYSSGQEMANALRSCLLRRDASVQMPRPSTVISRPESVLIHKPTLNIPFGKIFTALAIIAIISMVGILMYNQQVKNRPLAILKVESIPGGAQVSINGSVKGKTPITLNLPVGKYEARLSLKNYYEHESTISLNQSGETPVTIRLLEKE